VLNEKGLHTVVYLDLHLELVAYPAIRSGRPSSGQLPALKGANKAVGFRLVEEYAQLTMGRDGVPMDAE
jgi:hypothetical protein